MIKAFRFSTFIILFLSLNFSAFAQKDYTIFFKADKIPETQLRPISDINLITTSDNQIGNQHIVLLQFTDIPNEATINLLNQNNVQLLEYIPRYAYIASVPTTITSTTLTTAGVKNILEINPQLKLSRNLAADNYPDHAIDGSKINVVALPYRTISSDALQQVILQAGYTTLPNATSRTGFSVRLGINEITALASLAEVMYIEAIEAPPIPDGLLGRTSHRANLLSAAPGTGYDGTDVVMGIADDGGLSHIDFTGRLTDLTASEGGTHGDMVSGIACGAGNLDPTKLGMATGAYLYMYDIGSYPHVVNALSNYTNLGTVVTSTSYSQGCGGVYDSSSEALDADVYTQNELLHVFSAGNSASSNCSSIYGSITDPNGYFYGNITGGRKAAKSSIATANLEFDDDRTLSSSRGPCEDGRIKPDISAHGTAQQTTAPNNSYQSGGGTSAASPGIAGVSAMLYQAYKENNGGVEPPSSLIKSILLNTADDLGRSGPDYEFGWGRVNANRAVNVITNNTYINDNISQGGMNTHTITVPSNVAQVKIMTYWLDPAGTPSAGLALVNDIDMQVSTPGGATLNPWILSTVANLDSLEKVAYRGEDHINNMEQVTIDAPASGTYTISINGNTIPSAAQNYHVVYTFIMNEIRLTYPNGDEGLDPGETAVIRWDAFGNTNNFTLEYTTDNGSNWTTIANNVGADLRHFQWNIPPELSGDVLVRVSRAGQFDVSDSVLNIIGVPANLNVSGIDLVWDPVTGADNYDVFILGSKYMDYLGSTSSTNFPLTGYDDGNEYFFSVRATLSTSGITGRRAVAKAFKVCTNCNTPKTELPYVDNFERGLDIDDWCQSSADDIEWTLLSGSTGSTGTGPTQANSGGFYLYVEASGSNNPAKVAEIQSPCFDLTNFSNPALIFNYHMWGGTMGSLEILASDDQGVTWNSEWSISGDQGDVWNSVNIPLSAYGGQSLQILLRGTTGTSWESDIAIDDFMIIDRDTPTPEKCDLAAPLTNNGLYYTTGPSSGAGANNSDATSANWYTFTAPSDGYMDVTSCGAGIDTRVWVYEGACGALTQIATSDNDCDNGQGSFVASSLTGIIVTSGTTYYIEWDNFASSDGFAFDFQFYTLEGCNATITNFPYTQSFEVNIGDWQQDPSDDIDWTIDAGGTLSSNTGPSNAADGVNYIYTEASDPNFPSKVARLLSPCYELSSINALQLTFAYHMFGAAMGTLDIEISTDEGATWSAPIWSLSGDQGDSWQNVAIDLSNYAGQTVRFRIIGTTGTSWTSDIALDHVQIVESDYCITNLDIINELPVPEDIYRSQGTLTSYNSTIDAASNTEYISDTAIEIPNDFEVELGATFHAYIQACMTAPVQEEENETTKQKTVSDKAVETEKEEFKE